MMTKNQAQHLAAIVAETRPDWDQRGIVAALAKVRERDLADTCWAAIRAAENRTAQTPGFIPVDGDHWRPTTRTDTPRPPTRDEECRDHPGWFATNCAGCRADALARQET